MSAHAEHEGHGEHGATAASNDWVGKKLARFTGSAALTIGGELMTTYGLLAMPAGIAALTAATPAYLPIAAALTGSAIGAAIGWQGAKHAGIGEKSMYAGIKLLTPFSLLAKSMAPVSGYVMSGLSFISTALAMRHRK